MDEQENTIAGEAEQPQEVAQVEQQEQHDQAQEEARAFEQGFADDGQDVARQEPAKAPEPSEDVINAIAAKLGVEDIKQRLSLVDELKGRESKVFGSLGAMRQKIDALQRGGARQLSHDDFAELNAEYPDFAPLLVAGLNRALAGQPAVSQEVQPPEQQQPSAPVRTVDDVALAQEELAISHGDWKDVVQTEGFQKWKTSLSPQRQKVLDNSWNVAVLSRVLDEYKATLAPKKARQERLEAAITPRGVQRSTPAQTIEDAFLAGFNGG